MCCRMYVYSLATFKTTVSAIYFYISFKKKAVESDTQQEQWTSCNDPESILQQLRDTHVHYQKPLCVGYCVLLGLAMGDIDTVAIPQSRLNALEQYVDAQSAPRRYTAVRRGIDSPTKNALVEARRPVLKDFGQRDTKGSIDRKAVEANCHLLRDVLFAARYKRDGMTSLSYRQFVDAVQRLYGVSNLLTGG